VKLLLCIYLTDIAHANEPVSRPDLKHGSTRQFQIGFWAGALQRTTELLGGEIRAREPGRCKMGPHLLSTARSTADQHVGRYDVGCGETVLKLKYQELEYYANEPAGP
jgi:hypothetical protein